MRWSGRHDRASGRPTPSRGPPAVSSRVMSVERTKRSLQCAATARPARRADALPTMEPVVDVVGREPELAALAATLETVRAGRSNALVVCGEPGIGKTAILQRVRAEAAGCAVAEVAGARLEMGLPYAALHQLCRALGDAAD